MSESSHPRPFADLSDRRIECKNLNAKGRSEQPRKVFWLRRNRIKWCYTAGNGQHRLAWLDATSCLFREQLTMVAREEKRAVHMQICELASSVELQRVKSKATSKDETKWQRRAAYEMCLCGPDWSKWETRSSGMWTLPLLPGVQ